MYGKLPSEILSNVGFQGCLASIELNEEAADPINNALVPSEFVSSGCDGESGLGLLIVPKGSEAAGPKGTQRMNL